jgi:molybdopterin synthase catalytic subunit
MLEIKVLYFARCRELAGCAEELLALAPGATLQDASDQILERRPALATLLDTARFARNQEFARPDVELAHGDELAIIPPVSGGAPDSERFVITGEPIADDAAVHRLGDPPERRGALVTFAGIVRRDSAGRRVTHLDYEAYPPMAVAKMEAIGTEIRARWPVLDVSIVHRVGRLEVGDVAVSIAVSASHRAEAFDACRHAIERLKEDVPIWKRETGEDGETWWGRGP